MAKATKVDVSVWSLFKVAAVVLLFWFFYLIRGVVAILFVAVVLASALEPAVVWLVRRKIPRLIGVLIIYIIALAFVSLVIVLLLPSIAYQINNLANDFPVYWERVSAGVAALENYSQHYGFAATVQNGLQQVEAVLTRSGEGALETLVDIFGGVLSFLAMLVIAFYLLLEENAIKKTLRLVSPARYQPYLTQLLLKLRNKIGYWLRGQIILSLIIGLLVFVGLNVAGYFYPVFARYALVLSLLAFLLEFIPYLGPMLAAVPAIFIGLTQGLPVAAGVLLGYMLMQWLENNLIVPQVMKRAVGLNPIIIIIALMIGARVGGIIGMVLAIPLAAALSVLAEEVFRELDRRELD